MNHKTKIIFINQSSELYGSDKTLLDLVVGLKNNYDIDPIVIMQKPGLLDKELEKHGIEYHFIPVLKLHKRMFHPLYLMHLAYHSFASVYHLHKLIKKNNVPLIYSNAFSVMLGNAYRFWFKIHHIWHCHEIIESPKTFVRTYHKIVKSKLVDEVIYNSRTTLESWVGQDKIMQSKSNLVYNGIDLTINLASPESVNQLKSSLFPDANDQTLIYGNIGRISERKGIELLVDAFYRIQQNNPNVRLLFVGSPVPGKEDFLTHIENKIKTYAIGDKVKIVPFVKNVYPYWQVMDIAVIPSMEPEPFGLVAIEAMLTKKPVVAANHGGLTEIVDDQVTGYKFIPNNVDDLVNKLELLANEPQKIESFGENGFERVNRKFDVKKYVQNVHQVIKKYTA